MDIKRRNKEKDYTELLLKLSRREGEVLKLVSEGKTSKKIAEELNLSVRTVETHRYSICKKIGLSGRNALRKWIDKNL